MKIPRKDIDYISIVIYILLYFYFEQISEHIRKNNLYGIAEKLIGMIETMDLM